MGKIVYDGRRGLRTKRREKTEDRSNNKRQIGTNPEDNHAPIATHQLLSRDNKD